MPIYGTNDKFDAKKNYTEVRWGEQSKVLEVELSEMQKILRQHVKNAVSTILTNGFVNKPALTYVGSVLTVPVDTIIVNGTVVTLTENMTIGVGANTTVYLAMVEKEIDYTATINQSGNLSGGTAIASNGIQDPRYNIDTSRRKQMQVQLVTSNADATKTYFTVATIDGGSVMTDTRPLSSLGTRQITATDVTSTGTLKAQGRFILPNRTSDPSGAAPGEMWYRSDLG